MSDALVRPLSMDETVALYHARIREDFPPAERRPLSQIRRLHARGQYVCLVLEAQGRTLAYAACIQGSAIDSVLLDYFAVDESLRGSGVGSDFLARLPAQFPNKGGLLIECERPGDAKVPAEAEVRARRIAFYTRAGAQLTRLRWRAFGVVYNILWLPVCRPLSQADPARDLPRLYGLSLPAPLRPLVLRLTEDAP